ncbi:MAG TPA: serine/threonine-protein kinase [bacterium]|jgi:serine/threonine protein kinase
MQPKTYLNQKLNEFGVKYQLGKGAYATVYAAEDLEGISGQRNKLVALKIPTDQSKSYKKQMAEAEFLMELEHPGVVKVYSLEFNRLHNIFFFVMEILEGKDLEEIIDLAGFQPLPPKNTEFLIAQILDVLKYFKEKNIVHRDIKPANFIVDNFSGKLTLTDFGFANYQDQIDPKTLRAGTLYYMPPDQLDGNPTPASDVWAAGVILYRMLTGRLPFNAGAEPELIRLIREEDPQPIKELNPNAPDHLIEICGACLQKNPEERYAHTHDFSELLVKR